MKIAIMGFGTVGSGAYENAKNAGGIEVVKILARHGREGYEHLNDIITPDIDDIAGDPEIDLVVESMGGIEPAREYVLKCLRAGKHVVTPNKNLISACYSELMGEAEANGVKLRFTSAVGGGIPWLFNLLRTKRCDEILQVRGIVNGTCNYILDAMYDKGADFGEMLKIAQEIGYAEADPSADIEGTDTLRKTVISTNLAFDTAITEEDVLCAEYIRSLVDGNPIPDIARQALDLRLTEGKKFFDPAQKNVFPEEDFWLCTKPDIFDHVIRIIPNDGRLETEWISV